MFSAALLEKCIATPEQTEEAKMFGVKREMYYDNLTLTFYEYNDGIVITGIENKEKQ
jgi:hypothetical protein